MKMKPRKQEKLINDNSHSLTETLADLPVSDEQARHAKGGSDDRPTEEVSFNFGPAKVRLKQ